MISRFWLGSLVRVLHHPTPHLRFSSFHQRPHKFRYFSCKASMKPTWAETLGSNNWENLLDPLDIDVRKLILRCGDFCQATYDSFDNDQNSKYCGTSRYGKAGFFNKVMLEDANNYEVYSFLYATAMVSVPEAFLLHSQSRESWDRETNWIGYIAVTSDEYSSTIGRREVYVALRGTSRNYEWIDLLGAKQDSATSLLNPTKFKFDNNDDDSDDEDDDGTPKVMRGWMTIYTSEDPKSEFTKLSMRKQILSKINEIRKKYSGEDLAIIFTGHSLGASLSVLASFDVVENGVRDIPVAAFIFGSPEVGNKAFNERFKEFPNLKVLHTKNTIDLIPHYPGRLLGYRHTGVEFDIDTRKSPYLKESKHVGDWHNLQAMLHIVAGWNGKEKEFGFQVKRSVALVNKSCEFLKDELLVPGSWWVEKNKGLVRDDDGEWVTASPNDEDLPVPEEFSD